MAKFDLFGESVQMMFVDDEEFAPVQPPVPVTGTPRLAPDEVAAFDAAFQQVRELARDLVGAPWLSEWHGHEGGAG